MVGAVRFELTTSCTRNTRASQATLRPDKGSITCLFRPPIATRFCLKSSFRAHLGTATGARVWDPQHSRIAGAAAGHRPALPAPWRSCFGCSVKMRPLVSTAYLAPNAIRCDAVRTYSLLSAIAGVA